MNAIAWGRCFARTLCANVPLKFSFIEENNVDLQTWFLFDSSSAKCGPMCNCAK